VAVVFTDDFDGDGNGVSAMTSDVPNEGEFFGGSKHGHHMVLPSDPPAKVEVICVEKIDKSTMWIKNPSEIVPVKKEVYHLIESHTNKPQWIYAYGGTS
jgi:hypothetical protein